MDHGHQPVFVSVRQHELKWLLPIEIRFLQPARVIDDDIPLGLGRRLFEVASSDYIVSASRPRDLGENIVPCRHKYFSETSCRLSYDIVSASRAFPAIPQGSGAGR